MPNFNMENNTKIKILVFVNNYSKVMETFVYNHLSMVAADARFEVTVLCQNYPDSCFSIDGIGATIETGISTISNRIKQSFILLYKKPSLFFQLLKYGRNTYNMSLFVLAGKLKNTNFDIIHAHFGQNGKLIAELKDAGVINGKLITQFHGLDFTSKKCTKKGYYKTLIKRIDIILTQTQYSLNKLAKLGFPKDEIIAIPVGTDGSHFARKQPINANGILKIVFIGRLIELKGPQLIPDIASKMLELGFSNFEFLIVGEGSLKYEIIEKSKGIENKVKLLGYKSPDEIRNIMQDCHILIYPGIADREGREENQGMSTQEAMFMQLPVIVSKIGGVPEAVIDGESGFVCKPGDISEFATKTVLLCKNYDLRRSMGEKGFLLAQKNYEIMNSNEKIKDIYFGIK
ncbi:glycosyltransferase [Flavobacterium sp. 83]|uniref:glycosyltransferase n=1 Tax=Flavobacterium sp. 83 TaxID=1131812 RepID=UPI000554D4AD|nr:glycosyltransferase [Flavobacterium sp. 83]